MNIEKIKAEWEQDGTLDQARLTSELIRIPKLHHKYLSMLYQEKGLYEDICIKYDEMVHFKTLYFTGKLDEETLRIKGLHAFHVKLLRQDVDMYISADKDINEIRMRKALQKEKIFYIEDILKNINQRQFLIKTLIDWTKFTNGTN